MLFNSLEYLLAFLPLSVVGYFLLNRWRLTEAVTGWLIFAPLFLCLVAAKPSPHVVIKPNRTPS